jgi:hypothetical protein
MTPPVLLDALRPAALRRFGNDRRWAEACGLPPETLSRLRKRESCDLRTLATLASAVSYVLTVTPAQADPGAPFSREKEEELLYLCASGSLDAAEWRRHGEGFFMGGLATLLASVRGFDRRKYLALAEELHPGVTQTEVFDLWLQRSPLRAARFLPMLMRRRAHAA